MNVRRQPAATDTYAHARWASGGGGLNGQSSMTLEDVLDIYVQTENNLGKAAWVEEDRRPIAPLLESISNQTKYDLQVIRSDFYKDKPHGEDDSRDLLSLCAIYHDPSTTTRYANILLNEGVLNTCWARFCQIKEASHVLIREHFALQGRDYPNSATARELIDAAHRYASQPISLIQFERPDIPLDVKIEFAAEMVAMFLLYPINRLNGDREAIGKQVGLEGLRTFNYWDLANRYKVPEKHVSLLLSWPRLPYVFRRIEAKRKGVST